jgi:2'-5' RNA ligase
MTITTRTYVLVSAPLPDHIADLLPNPREDVRPHISIVSPAPVFDVDAIREAFRAGEFSTGGPIAVELDGVGDFRTDTPPTPVIFLRVTAGADRLAALAASIDARLGLRRRFPFHPHVTLTYYKPDDELNRVAEAHKSFRGVCDLTAMTLSFGTSPDTMPPVITWGPGTTYAL